MPNWKGVLSRRNLQICQVDYPPIADVPNWQGVLSRHNLRICQIGTVCYLAELRICQSRNNADGIIAEDLDHVSNNRI